MIALAADALAAMRDLQNVKTGQMAVAASQTTGVYLMPPLIGAAFSPAKFPCLMPVPATAMILPTEADSETAHQRSGSTLNP